MEISKSPTRGAVAGHLHQPRDPYAATVPLTGVKGGQAVALSVWALKSWTGFSLLSEYSRKPSGSRKRCRIQTGQGMGKMVRAGRPCGGGEDGDIKEGKTGLFWGWAPWCRG